ncbi:MAG: hypothetical protein HY225_00595, partial [Candidatus Vogelbacteria bacterium]|nr:hypothetical protein [Candidatus Vogelbacteria bacterium]
MKTYNTYQYIIWILIALFLGYFLAAIVLHGVGYFFGNRGIKRDVITDTREVATKRQQDFKLGQIRYNKFVPSRTGKEIYVDTYSKTLLL